MSRPQFVLALPLTAACVQNVIKPQPDPDNQGPTGSILGRVCDPSGKSWLADAVAYAHLYDEQGNLMSTVETYSDPDGFWLLDDLPPNVTYTVYVQNGPEILFTDDIHVGMGEDVVLPEPSCFDPNENRVAVITGSYDDFESVLTTMGFDNYTIVDGTGPCPVGVADCIPVADFLGDESWMAQFDIIFFNGGMQEAGLFYPTDDAASKWDVAADLGNVKTYVENGGSIYVSDWAYDVVEQIWPDRIDFVGDDTVPDAAQTGETGTLQASISDNALAAWLGKDGAPEMDVSYLLPVWPPMAAVDPSVSVHLSGSPSYRVGETSQVLTQVPLLASFNAGQGRVVVSTFPVATNASTDMLLVLQYMIYDL